MSDQGKHPIVNYLEWRISRGGGRSRTGRFLALHSFTCRARRMLDNRQLAQHRARPRRLPPQKLAGVSDTVSDLKPWKVQVALCMDRKLDATFERMSCLAVA